MLLAQLLGLYFLIIGVIVLYRRKSIMPAIGQMISNRALLMILGLVELLAGLAVILTYPQVSASADAGNFYEEIVYAIAGSKPCTAVRYFIHSTNIGNYDPGTVREFDRGALISAFDAIRASLTLTSAAPAATSTAQ